MLPIIPKPAISPRQKAAALAVAGLVDLLQMGGFLAFFEGAASPPEDLLDFLTAAVLVAICGFRWQFFAAFFMELLPVVDIFPTWTALVLTLPTARAPATPPQIHVEQVSPPPPPPEPRTHASVVDVEAVAVPPVQDDPK
jgi:hypothetical protein